MVVDEGRCLPVDLLSPKFSLVPVGDIRFGVEGMPGEE